MYELLIVSKLSESDGLVGRVEKALKSASAEDIKINKLGKKNLAYNIKKQTEAEYTIFTFRGEGTVIGEISEMLRLEQDALLRHIIVKQKIRKLRKKVMVREQKVEVKREEKKPQVTVVTKSNVSKVSEGTEGAKVRKSAKVEVSVKVAKRTEISKGSKVSKVTAKGESRPNGRKTVKAKK